MIKYAEPIMRKKFVNDDLRKAKMDALKWLGKFVIGRDELRDVSYTMRCEKDHFPTATVTLTLFAFLDEGEAKERHCKICKEFHSHFFINENCNCNECKAMAFESRMSDMLRVKKAYYKENLKKIIQSEGQV